MQCTYSAKTTILALFLVAYVVSVGFAPSAYCANASDGGDSVTNIVPAIASASGLTVTVAPFEAGPFSFAGGNLALVANGTWYVGVDLYRNTLIALPRLGHRGWVPVARVVTESASIKSVDQITPVLPASRIPRAIAKMRMGQSINVVVMGSSLAEGGGTTTWSGMLFNASSNLADYKIPSLGTFNNIGLGGSPNQFMLAQLGYALPEGRSTLFNNVDLVVLTCLANGGDYRLAIIEPLIRQLKKRGVEIILLTDNPQNPTGDYSSMLNTLLYKDGPEPIRIADLYGIELADTAAYVFEQHLRYRSGIYSDAIHMKANAPAGPAVAQPSGGHEVYARSVRSLMPLVPNVAGTAVSSFDFDNSVQGFTSYATASVERSNGKLKVIKTTANTSQWGAWGDIPAVKNGDTVRIKGTWAYEDGYSGNQISVGTQGGGLGWGSTIASSPPGAFDLMVTLSRDIPSAGKLLFFGNNDFAPISSAFSLDNLEISINPPVDLIPGRAAAVLPLPPKRVVADLRTPSDAIVILPRDEDYLKSNHASRGSLGSHPNGANSFARRFFSSTGATQDLLTLIAGQKALVDGVSPVGFSIIRHASSNDAPVIVEVRRDGTLLKTLNLGAGYNREGYDSILTPNEFGQLPRIDNDRIELTVISGTLRICALIVLTSDLDLLSPQTLDFPVISDRILGPSANTFSLSANASSGLPITFSVVSGPATVSGSTLALTGVGSVTIRASQAGNESFASANPVERTFTVAKAEQTITFATVANKTYGDAPFSLSASSSSGLPVNFTVVSGPATLSGEKLILSGAGLVAIRAFQTGNDSFKAASPVDRTFMVSAASHTSKNDWGGWLLRSYFEKTRRLADSQSEKLSVLLVGDSWTHGQRYWVQSLFRELYPDYGGAAGGGFCGFGFFNDSGAINGSADTAFITGYRSHGNWTQEWNASGSVYALDGTHIRSSIAGASVTVNLLQAHASARIHYRKQSGGGTFRWRIDSGEWTSVSTNGTGGYGLLPVAIPDAACVINIEVESAGASGVILNGIDAQRATGVVFHKCAQSGGTASNWLNYVNDSHFREGVGHLAPDLCVIMFATNEQNGNISPSAFKSSVLALAAKVREQRPLCDFLFMCPPENGLQGKAYTMAEYSAALYDAAVEFGAGFISHQQYWGAYSSYQYTIDPNLSRNWMGPDGIHPSADGGSALVDTIYNFLHKSYISFEFQPDRIFGDAPFTLPAITTSGLPITFSVISGPAALSGNTLTITGAGSITVQASQAGNSRYGAASATRTFTVAKASQSIVFNAPATAGYGNAPLALSATASSGLPVAFSIVSGPGNLNGSQLTVTGPGSVVIRSTQAGDTNYNPAPPVKRTIAVTTAPQAIDFTQIADRTFNPAANSLSLSASATSGLAVSFSVTSGPATVSGNRLTVTGAGSVTIHAAQAGNTEYASASATRSFMVAKAQQTIAFTAPDNVQVGAPAFKLAATATSGLPVAFSVSGPATLTGNLLTLTGTTGTVTVTASQAGDANYNPAPAIERTLTISQTANAQIALQPRTFTFTGSPQTLTAATTPAGLRVTFTYKLGTAAPVPTAPTSPGVYTVTATLDDPAASNKPTASATLTITKAPLTVTAQNVTRAVGAANPTLALSYSGFVGSDTPATALSSAPVATTKATAASAPGSYPITLTGGVSNNYALTLVPGTLTVVGFGGTYEGLLLDTDSVPVGKLSLTIPAAALSYTGTLTLTRETKTIPIASTSKSPGTTTFAGSVDLANAVATWTRTTTGLDALELAVTVSADGSLTGSLKRNGQPFATLAFGSRLRVLAKGQTALGAGANTFVIHPADNRSDSASGSFPGGSGFATAPIAATTGVLTLSGLTADGAPLTASLKPTLDDTYLLWVNPYGTRADSFIAGALPLEDHPETTRFPGRAYIPRTSGLLTWQKAALPANTATAKLDKSYRAGFGPLDVEVSLDPWLPPAASTAGAIPAGTLAQRLGLAASTTTAGLLSIAHGPDVLDLGARESLLPLAASLSPAGVFTATNAAATAWTVKITPATGAFTGSFTLSDQVAQPPAKPVTRKVTFSGVLRQAPANESEIGTGFFLVPGFPASKGAVPTEQPSGEIRFSAP